MATQVYTDPHGWHEGESQMHHLLRVPDMDDPTSFGLSPYATHLLHLSSLLAVGTLDEENRPWTTLIGGASGFARSLGKSVVGVKTVVGAKHDPVIEVLTKDGSRGQVLSGLGIHLDTRDRVKLSGRLLGGGLFDASDPDRNDSTLQEMDAAELQMAFAVEQSLGNCPKYLNRKTPIPIIPQPTLLSDTLPLCAAAIALLSKADTFFISSSHQGISMDTNHRGGPPGFVRLASNTAQRSTLIYPEYSGNRYYQTLGNLYTTPRAGLVFPDFSTGDVLYVTGTTEIIHGKEAAELLPRSNLLVKIHLTAARYVQRGLAFRATANDQDGETAASPYNPPLRYLASERPSASATSSSQKTALSATLISKTILTPTIARFTFRLSSASPSTRPPSWKAGQYIALSLADELSGGYSHMRDDDPRSLNDDFVRTFTISSSPLSPPPGAGAGVGKDTTFDITIRALGTATNFLLRQNPRAGLTLPVLGIEGSFRIDQSDGPSTAVVPFIASGVGITPLLSQLGELAWGRVRVYWTVKVGDAGLVVDTLERWPGVAGSVEVFFTGAREGVRGEGREVLEKVKGMGVRKVVGRRIEGGDLDLGLEVEGGRWYLCAGKGLRKELVGWVEGEGGTGRRCVFEDFGY